MKTKPKKELPPKSQVETFADECRAGLEVAEGQLPGLLDVEGTRDVDNLLVPYNELLRNVDNSAATASLMRSVHPDEDIRKAAEKCEQDVSAFITELTLNKKLWQAFTKVDNASLDDDAKRLVDHTLRDFRRAGVDKDDETRARLKEIDEEMVKLGQTFGKNIVEDVREITMDSADGLAGLPEDFIKAHQPKDDGKIHITTDYPDYIPFVTYADSTELRKQLYIENRSRGGDENEEVLKQILVLRSEKAKILGFANWADYATEDKMMKSSKNVSKFIERVVRTSRKRAKRDYKELLKWKRKNRKKKAKFVEDYEKTYIENKVKAESYAFDSQSVRPYFPYEQTERGLLDITSTMYGISYEKATDAELWHEDVKSYDVMRDGAKIGRIYLDMHPREGKYKHAAQFTLRTGVDGSQLPEGVLVCNFANPRTNAPALMVHDDVITMFHEFGHLMHHILGGKKKWIEQSGVATEWDFVEAPSQMFEEWAWNHESLSIFAKHHETGEVIPAELVERMTKAHKFGIGVQTLQQMFYASISLGFHMADPASLDMLATVKRLQKKYTPFRYVEGTKFHASFGHLNGYSALYYTYMWSLVIAKDLLTPFKKHGIMNSEWTAKYRDLILAPGGTKDAADLVEQFLGRKFNYKAFEKYLTE